VRRVGFNCDTHRLISLHQSHRAIIDTNDCRKKKQQQQLDANLIFLSRVAIFSIEAISPIVLSPSADGIGAYMHPWLLCEDWPE